MMRTRLKPDRRSVAFLGVALVGILAGGTALFYQQERSLGSVIHQLQDRERQRDDSQRLASRLAETELRLTEDKNRLKFLEASLPDMAYVPTLLKQIEQLGRDTHNQVRGVRPEPTVARPVRPAVRRTDPEAQENGDDKQAAPAPKPEPYTRLPISVSLTGSYKDYQQFLQGLTSFPKIVAVDKVQLRPNLDPSDKSNSSPKLEVEMLLTAFILKDSAPMPAPPADGNAASATTTAAPTTAAAAPAPGNAGGNLS